jgi:hypothetical protein
MTSAADSGLVRPVTAGGGTGGLIDPAAIGRSLRVFVGVRLMRHARADLEPPALDRLDKRCHITLLAGLFERRIQILVVPLRMSLSAFAASTARIAVGVRAGRGTT